jgi:hypothetical protein
MPLNPGSFTRTATLIETPDPREVNASVPRFAGSLVSAVATDLELDLQQAWKQGRRRVSAENLQPEQVPLK